jgi:cobalt-zinc-cadmium efflux system protein
VSDVHDLHIWPISTTNTALTCHLVMTDGHPGDDFLARVAHDLDHRFSIDHPTIQIERARLNACRTAGDCSGQTPI